MNEQRNSANFQQDTRAYLQAEFTEIVRAEIGMNDHFAADMAAAFLRGMCSRLGGKELWVPTEDKTARNEAIKSTFNGSNLDHVCRRFGVSKATVYRVVGER